MIGLGVYDSLAREITDPETGEIYPALSCYNDKTMADRCASPLAPKVIWSIKASAQFNSDCAIMLRDAFRSGRIRLLANEYDAEEYLSSIKGYSTMNPAEKIQIQLPYIHTTLLIDELTKLEHDESNGRVRIYERPGMRKDRYSSISYNFYVSAQLENKLAKRQTNDDASGRMFAIKPPNYRGKVVNNTSGKGSTTSWHSYRGAR